MSKMSELSQVLDEMIACGERMIKAANTLKDIFSSTEEAPVKTETKAAAFISVTDTKSIIFQNHRLLFLLLLLSTHHLKCLP